MGTGFVEVKLIAFLTESLYQLNKRIFGKGVMLCGNAKSCFLRNVCDVFILKKLHLLEHLPDVAEKFHSFLSECNSCPTAQKYGNSCFFFNVFQGIRQTGL